MKQHSKDMKRLLKRTALRWNLEVVSVLHTGSRRSVAKVKSHHGLAALKLNASIGGEGGAVPVMKGVEADVFPKLYRVSPLRRAILMEWVEGCSLIEMYNAGRTSSAEQLLAEAALKMNTARIKFRSGLVPLTNGIAHRFRRTEQRDSALADTPQFKRAKRLFEQLTDNKKWDTVLHGDLHFENVIATLEGPRLIDPKGFRGDPAADCARALIGPDHLPTISEQCERMSRRAGFFREIISEDPKRIIQWSAVIHANAFFYRTAKIGKTAPVDPYITAYLDLAEA